MIKVSIICKHVNQGHESYIDLAQTILKGKCYLILLKW